MTAEFAYTVEDLREAAVAHARAHAKAQDAQSERGDLGVWFVAIVALVFGLLVLKTIVFRAGRGAGVAVLPMVFVGIIVVMALFVILRNIFRPRPQVDPPLEMKVDATRGVPLRQVLVWVVGILIAIPVAAYIYAKQEPPAPASPASTPLVNPAMDLLITFLPWILIGGFLFFFIRLRLKLNSPEAVMEKNPSLQLRRRMDADERGVIIDDGQAKIEMAWVAIRRFVESPNLFLLYLSNDSFHMIPKRAFDGSDGEAFRELLRANIQPMTRAFPVLPAEQA